MSVDQDKLNTLVEQFVADLGATMSAGSIVIGHRLGLYRGLAAGPATAADLAARTKTHPRHVEEWLRCQTAGGYITYDPHTGFYRLTEEQAYALTDPEGSMYLPGAFVRALGALRAEPQITEAFRTGGGFPWHAHDPDVFVGTELFLRPAYLTNLIPHWIPALDGVEDRLQAGATVADVGCGLGASTALLAQAYPRSTFSGSDYHQPSIEQARKRAADAGVGDRTTFEVATAQTFTGTGYDLVATFDCLHDMGDPVGAARHVRDALTPDGSWLIVEPLAGETLADNLNPRGRMYYSISQFLCVPNGLAQPGGYALGAQAGETAIRQIVTDGGFTRFHRAAQTPFNVVYQARP